MVQQFWFLREDVYEKIQSNKDLNPKEKRLLLLMLNLLPPAGNFEQISFTLRHRQIAECLSLSYSYVLNMINGTQNISGLIDKGYLKKEENKFVKNWRSTYYFKPKVWE